MELGQKWYQVVAYDIDGGQNRAGNAKTIKEALEISRNHLLRTTVQCVAIVACDVIAIEKA